MMTVVLLVCVAGTAGAQSPLVDAVKAGDTAGVRALIEKRVDVNAAEADGTTPLHWAVDRDAPTSCRCWFAPAPT